MVVQECQRGRWEGGQAEVPGAAEKTEVAYAVLAATVAEVPEAEERVVVGGVEAHLAEAVVA